MANYNNVSELFKDICDKLRAKLGTSDPINHSDIPQKIEEIETGGGETFDVDSSLVYHCFNVSDSSTFLSKENEVVERIENNEFGNKLLNLEGYFNNTKNISDLAANYFSIFSSNPPISVKNMFKNSGFNSIDLSNFDTSKCFDMSSMFYNCPYLTSLNMSNLDTSNCHNMSYMFYTCNGFTSLDLSNFDTSKCFDMSYMFQNCNGLTSLNVSNFDTSKCTTLQQMFNQCSRLTSLNVSNFDTSNCTTLQGMFSNCSKLTSLDVSNFDTSKCITLQSMFSSCSKLTSLDVSNFNTSNCISTYQMFNNCSSLISLDLSNFNTKKCNTVAYMFYGCNGLTNLVLPDFMCISSTPSNFISSTSPNLTITWGGEVKSFGDPTNSSTIILNLTQIWKGSTSTFISNYETFANSIGPKQGDYTRQIKLNTNLYNALSDSQKALITDKGYTLTYGTS